MTDHDFKTFSGSWFVKVTYPNKDDSGIDTTINRMEAQKLGKEIVFTSEPNEEGSHMVIRLSVDEDIATGTWHETTAPSGQYAGAMYSGAGQLLITDDGTTMNGQWAGAGIDHEQDKPNIYVGTWKLSRTEF